MVRAGWGGAFVEDFVDGSFVSIGFPNAGEVTSPVNKKNSSRLKHLCYFIRDCGVRLFIMFSYSLKQPANACQTKPQKNKRSRAR